MVRNTPTARVLRVLSGSAGGCLVSLLLLLLLLAGCSFGGQASAPATPTTAQAVVATATLIPTTAPTATPKPQPTATPRPKATATPKPVVVTVAITGTGPFVFSPATLSIKVGTTVKWVNQTTAPHTVASTPSGPLNSPTLNASGGTFSYTFAAAGTYAYACSIHPSMTGSITVTA